MKPYRHEPIKTGTTAARELRIDLRPAEKLKPNPANARVHSKKQIPDFLDQGSCVRRESATILDTWHTLGMRGTGYLIASYDQASKMFNGGIGHRLDFARIKPPA